VSGWITLLANRVGRKAVRTWRHRRFKVAFDMSHFFSHSGGKCDIDGGAGDIDGGKCGIDGGAAGAAT
jgi:hypothetical protein